MKNRQKQNKKKYATRKHEPYWKRCGYSSIQEYLEYHDFTDNKLNCPPPPKPGTWAYDLEHAYK